MVMSLEEKSKKSSRKQTIQKAILASVAVAGVLSIAVVAPNAVQLLRSFGFNPKNSSLFTSRTNRARRRLIEKGLLEYKNNNRFVQLTSRGERQLRLWGLAGYKVKTPKRWDKKFRILSFDIKEKRRGVRNKLRTVLRKMGFYPLQQSLWIYPYDCEEFIQLLKADFRIGWDVLYIIADQIDNEKRVKEYFDL